MGPHGHAHFAPKDGDGIVEQIRVLLSARRSAMKARSSTMQQIKSLLVTAPDTVRGRWRSSSDRDLITGLATTRPDDAQLSVTAATGTALRTLARRYQHLSEEITAMDAPLTALVTQASPELAASFGVGTTTAAQLLVTAGDNPERLRSEAAFAALCDVAPIPASSGKTNRHRLNRGGDRDANRALHTIDLRPLRVSKAITLDQAATHFHVWPATISRLERCNLRDDHLAHIYRDWLTQQPDSVPTKRMLTMIAP